ncbi:hypothetical protein [Pseudomonas sp. LFM046]|uniref:hypothetical protein n=1 Tax=Pseudomonas sp. LFM046 TaxID=1608357 RepID=UPI0005CFBC99|nr:hypothetical protein [Pseudomonas sp. LFM046]
MPAVLALTPITHFSILTRPAEPTLQQARESMPRRRILPGAVRYFCEGARLRDGAVAFRFSQGIALVQQGVDAVLYVTFLSRFEPRLAASRCGGLFV